MKVGEPTRPTRRGLVYSSLLLSNGGEGMQKMFTIPLGQQIPTIGAPPATTPKYQKAYSYFTTNISQAGQFGTAIGDAHLRGFRVRLEHGHEAVAEQLKAVLDVVVAGRLRHSENDVGALVGREVAIDEYVVRTDCFEVRLNVVDPLRLKKSALLWVEFYADITADVR